MDAGSVVFSRSYTEPDSALRKRQFDTATVPVQTGNRLFGCLLVGERSSGQKYLSEDLAFLDKVAGLTAGMLQNIELGEEADFLEAYLAIKHVRFEEMLHYRIDIPEELRECLIPPMIIQPLVENAVIHGIWPKRAGGSIVVAARRIDSKLHISVEDDGEGFDCKDSYANNCGIGLQNVRSRIKTLDPANHLRVDSKRGAGTMVAFELPFEIAEKEFAFAHIEFGS